MSTIHQMILYLYMYLLYCLCLLSSFDFVMCVMSEPVVALLLNPTVLSTITSLGYETSFLMLLKQISHRLILLPNG